MPIPRWTTIQICIIVPSVNHITFLVITMTEIVDLKMMKVPNEALLSFIKEALSNSYIPAQVVPLPKELTGILLIKYKKEYHA